jgi:hypothetical protein
MKEILATPCRRQSGKFRAYFSTEEAAKQFAANPANTAYHEDVAHECPKCGYWHLSKIEWLVNAPIPETVN